MVAEILLHASPPTSELMREVRAVVGSQPVTTTHDIVQRAPPPPPADAPDDVVGAAGRLRVLPQCGHLARGDHAEEVEGSPRAGVDGGVHRQEGVPAPAARRRVQVGARVGAALHAVLAEPVVPAVRRRHVEHICGREVGQVGGERLMTSWAGGDT